MIMTVEELRRYVTTDETDEMLAARLEAVELRIRKRTNNNFQKRGFRTMADSYGNKLECDSVAPFTVGDTLMISESDLMPDCLCTIKAIEGKTITVNESLFEEDWIMITKVEYPVDVKMGVVEMIRWKLKNEAANSGDKGAMNVQSETISRYSVTYAQDSTESVLDADFGVPVKYTGFLKSYQKARF